MHYTMVTALVSWFQEIFYESCVGPSVFYLTQEYKYFLQKITIIGA